MEGAGVATTILTFSAIVGIGALLRWRKILVAEDAKALNAVIIYVGLPAFIFEAVHTARLSLDILKVVGVAWVVFLLVLGLAWLLTTRVGDRSRRGAMLLTASLGNTGYIGYPVTAALLGATALPTAVFYDVFGTVFCLVLVGLPIATRFGSLPSAARHPLRELATFPAVIALVFGLLTRGVPIWEPVSNGLELLAKLVAPLIMLSVGVSLRPRELAKHGAGLGLVAGLRLVVAPLLALALGAVFLDGAALRVAVLEAGVPSMMLTLVVGERFGLDTDFTASAIFATTVLSAASIPLIQALAF